MPGPDPLGDPLAVHITGREIYDAVVRLTGRVDVLIEQQTAIRQDVQDHEQRLRTQEDVRAAPRLKALEETRLPALEDRMRGIEARQWPLPAASLLLALASLAVALLPRLVG